MVDKVRDKLKLNKKRLNVMAYGVYKTAIQHFLVPPRKWLNLTLKETPPDKALRKLTKVRSTRQLIQHLERLMEPWMVWSQFGITWGLGRTVHTGHFQYWTKDDPGYKEAWRLEYIKPKALKAPSVPNPDGGKEPRCPRDWEPKYRSYLLKYGYGRDIPDRFFYPKKEPSALTGEVSVPNTDRECEPAGPLPDKRPARLHHKRSTPQTGDGTSGGAPQPNTWL